jgi:phosphatidylserine decarboxylase
MYCATFSVDLSDAREAGPYPSFDAFFTRRLRDGCRPISTADVVSPADGLLSVVGPVDSGQIAVKRQTYDVAELLGSGVDGAKYEGGAFCVVYLSPRDYHRVHAPVDGSISLVRGITGDLYPVNSIGERHVTGLFVRNNRVVVFIDTPAHGRVAVVLVGATIVGRISVTMIPEPAVPPGDTVLPSLPVRRGDELGMFHLGSTAVVLFEAGTVLSRETGSVRMGEGLVAG